MKEGGRAVPQTGAGRLSGVGAPAVRPALRAGLAWLAALAGLAPTVRPQDAPLRLGEVIEQVACLDDPSQSYALFLPSAYSRDRNWPILYAFDPLARGRVPVELFSRAAERLGVIVVS